MQKPWHDRLVTLPGRGSVVVREWSGPQGAPVLVLLHGVALDVDTNWSLAGDARAGARGTGCSRSTCAATAGACR